MTLRAHIKAFGLISVFLTTASAAVARDVTVFAAASLRGALDEIAATHPDDITVSYAGSGLIARQVAQGAPADVVVLAHPNWMDWLDERAQLISQSRTNVATNALVVIAHIDAPAAGTMPLATWLKPKKIAMGQRDAVPAGIYAKQWLETVGLWNDLRPNLVETDNVRLALALVARGDVPAGITYRSDAVSEPRVQIIHQINPETHTPIQYPAAAITDAGRMFVTYLASPDAQAIFKSYGFAPQHSE